MSNKISEIILKRLKDNNISYKGCDNISEYINNNEINLLINECTEIFEKLLDVLLIDKNDKNIVDTPKRLSNMYINELFKGRYYKLDEIKEFPVSNYYNNNNNILIIKTTINSTCSHHFLPINGYIYIGFILNNTNENVLGLSKYYRLCDWCSRRAILQEELIITIKKEFIKILNNDNLAILIQAKHDCCAIRGIKNIDFNVTNLRLSGIFEKPDIKETFINLISMQKNI